MRVGLIGDYDEQVTAHRAIPLALQLSAKSIGVLVTAHWLPTELLGADSPPSFEGFDLLWCVPASPYHSMEGALNAIRFARETGTPFLGTCGGFQHALIEYARTVIGLAGADHAETSPDATTQIVTPLACALVEASGDVLLEPGSRLRAIYGADRVRETYRCSYAMNPEYETVLAARDLRFVARDADGGVRALELTGHPFFIATLYQPERSALGGAAHPLITAAMEAATRAPRAARAPAPPV